MKTLHSSPSAPEAPAPPVGRAALRGVFWTLLCSGIGKGISLFGQLALAWFLWPEDFGLAAMAISVGALLSFAAAGCLYPILVGRHQEFMSLAPGAFWLGLTLNTVAGLGVAAAGPLVAWACKEPRLNGLMWIVAAALPLGALPIVYSAKLAIELRFREVAWIHLAQGILHIVSAVILAALGFGPYALVLPLVWVPVIAAGLTRWAAGPVPLWGASWEVWATLLGRGRWVMFQSLLGNLEPNGTRFVLGLVAGQSVMGLFSWGHTLAMSAVFLVAANLGSVFFPTLAHLNNEPLRQYQAFRRSATTLLALTLPMCVIQALCAGPLVALLFDERWRPAVGVIQWLSLGTALVPLSMLGASLLLAQQRLGVLCLLTAAQGVAVVGAALGGALWGQAGEISACVAVAMVLGSIGAGIVALRVMAQTPTDLIAIIRGPLAAALPALLGGYIAGILCTDWIPLAQLALVSAVACVIYLALFRLLCRGLAMSLIRDLVPLSR